MTTGKRTVAEWIGKTPDQAIPMRVRLRVFDRFNGICQISKRKITPADKWSIDHVIPLANGGEHVESNMQPVIEDAEGHKAKTRDDMALKKKIERVRKKHHGQWPKGRGFASSRSGKFKTKIGGEVVRRED